MALRLVLLLMMVASVAEAAPELRTWARPAGPSPGSEAIPPAGARRLNLSSFPTAELRLYDVQYGAERRYRGVALSDVLAAVPGGPALDTALLHFDNGMMLRSPRWPDREPSPFLAIEWSHDGQSWSPSFPEVRKAGHEADDPRPIRFAGHKVVYRGADARALPEWSPWRHTSSIVGIELVNGAAYDRQFELADGEEERAGLAVFRRYCQACHGVRGVGARFGWDGVEPIALSEHRKPAEVLYYHVKFRELDAAQRGFMMPAFRSISEDEVRDLWRWLKAAAKTPLRPYAPPGGGAPAGQ